MDERRASLTEAALVFNDGEPEDGASSFEAEQNPFLWEKRQEYKRSLSKHLMKDNGLSDDENDIAAEI